eukprot:scaffold108987_cov36-Prasinocladus_malaysianus.AAC.1
MPCHKATMHGPICVVAGGGLVAGQGQTKNAKSLPEDAGWLCKSPGHRISEYSSGQMPLPLTASFRPETFAYAADGPEAQLFHLLSKNSAIRHIANEELP